MFNTEKDYFFWVLNEEEYLPDTLEALGPNTLMGGNSGFGFYVDTAYGSRKVLASVSRSHAGRNGYFDGPFDQLADNHAEEVNIMHYLERGFPSLAGNLDTYGNIINAERPWRADVSTYYVHDSCAHLQEYMQRVLTAEDPLEFISISRRELDNRRFTTPTPTP